MNTSLNAECHLMLRTVDLDRVLPPWTGCGRLLLTPWIVSVCTRRSFVFVSRAPDDVALGLLLSFRARRWLVSLQGQVSLHRVPMAAGDLASRRHNLNKEEDLR